MSVKLGVDITTSVDRASLDGTCSDIENGFKGLGDSLSVSLSKGLDSFTKGAGKTLQTALGDSIIDGVTDGLDNLDSIWEKAWDSLAKIAKNALSNALGGLVINGLSSFFNFSSSGGSSGGGTNILSALGLVAKSSGGGEGLTGGVTSFLDFGDGEALAGALGGGEEGLGLIGGQALGDLGGLEGMAAGIEGAAGVDAAAEGVLGLSSGATVAGAILAPLAIGQLASMLGLMDGTSPIDALFGQGGGHTKESAQSTITADMEYLAQAAQVLQTALEGADTGAQAFATTMLTQMSGASLEMSRLAERAGLSDQEIDAMVEALDPASAKLLEASESVGLINEKIDAMDNVLELGAESFAGVNTAGSEFQDMLLGMADSMGLPAEAGDALTASIKSLIQQWTDGQISSEHLSACLKTTFATALGDLATQTSTTTDQMKALTDSIKSIPTDWTSTINVVYNTVGNPPTYSHSGGMLMHGGGWLGNLSRYHSGAQVTPLFNDEVPLIAQRGEFIVRRDSVNAATLPLLKALNQGGSSPASQPPQVNLHMEVHGNLMGDESAFNDLARLLEEKMRDLAQSRYAA